MIDKEILEERVKIKELQIKLVESVGSAIAHGAKMTKFGLKSAALGGAIGTGATYAAMQREPREMYRAKMMASDDVKNTIKHIKNDNAMKANNKNDMLKAGAVGLAGGAAAAYLLNKKKDRDD